VADSFPHLLFLCTLMFTHSSTNSHHTSSSTPPPNSHIYTHARTYTFIHSRTYTRNEHTHTHTHTHIHILALFLSLVCNPSPHIVFLPHTADTHPTHRNVLRAVLGALAQLLSASHQEALKRSDAGESTFCIELYMYEGPWSLFPPRGYNTICSPPSDMFSKKMAAIDAHVSQTGRTPYGKAAEALAVLRASLVPEQDLAGFGEQPPKLEDKVCRSRGCACVYVRVCVECE
jgi:hypothetical protein